MYLKMFHDFFPKVAEEETRTVVIIGDRPVNGVPPGTYGLIEFLCDDPDCDCRRVVLSVFCKERRKPEASVGFAFDRDDPMPGPYLDPLNPAAPHAEALLEMVSEVLRDPEYVTRLERHYEMVKQRVGAEKRPEVGVAGHARRAESWEELKAAAKVLSKQRKKRRVAAERAHRQYLKRPR